MIRSLSLPGSFDGVKFLLSPDFSKINGEVILAALGQVFFSLSLGMGCMVTYGSYLSKDENIAQSSIIIPLIDTLIALLAGLAILPAVFSIGLDPAGGPGLVFVTLPAVFAQMAFGGIFAFVFFTLVLFAALTSSISLLEVCVSYVVDEFRIKRSTATLVLAGSIFLFGIPASLGLGTWSHIKIIKDNNIFDSIIYVTDRILLPLGGLFLCIFVGWVWGVDKAIEEATNNGKHKFIIAPVWAFLIRWIIPLVILVVFLQGLLS